jgi:hypothetical protein
MMKYAAPIAAVGNTLEPQWLLHDSPLQFPFTLLANGLSCEQKKGPPKTTQKVPPNIEKSTHFLCQKVAFLMQKVP